MWRFLLLRPSLVYMGAHPARSSGHPKMSIVANVRRCGTRTPLSSCLGRRRPIAARARIATPPDVCPPAHLTDGVHSIFHPKLLAVDVRTARSSSTIPTS
eukprot:8981766-Pyramimonas_sp.AAC.1